MLYNTIVNVNYYGEELTFTIVTLPHFFEIKLMKGIQGKMEKKIKSNMTGKEYLISKCVRIINPFQIACYLENGVELLDLYTSRDSKTNRPIIVAIFDREGSYDSYKLWCEHKLG